MKVRCLSHDYRTAKYGEIYEVNEEFYDCYYLKSPANTMFAYNKTRFVVIEEESFILYGK